jgi:hypothetical protein
MLELIFKNRASPARSQVKTVLNDYVNLTSTTTTTAMTMTTATVVATTTTTTTTTVIDGDCSFTCDLIFGN